MYVEKSQIHREHMERVKGQITAEEEAFKLSRTIKEGDTKNYRKESFSVIRRIAKLSDWEKLIMTRIYQILSGIIGLVGTGMIVLSINDSKTLWPIYEKSIREMSLLWPGLALAIISVVAKIWLQHKHDKLSDRIIAEHHAET